MSYNKTTLLKRLALSFFLVSVFSFSYILPKTLPPRKEKYADYYKESLFYVGFSQKSSFNRVLPAGLALKAKAYNLKGAVENIGDFERLDFPEDAGETLFFCKVDSKYTGITFQLYSPIDNVIWMTTFETDIKPFQRYTIAYSDAYYYDFSSCYWGDAKISPEVFSSFFLANYSKSNSGELFGPRAYPNLLYSFYEQMEEKKELEKIAVNYLGNVVFASNLWAQIADDFQKIL